jgi:cation-transporting P-type ATPase 13A2
MDSQNNRRSSSAGRRSTTLKRRDSNRSALSAMLDDIEFSVDDQFSGPISESVPSSVTGFAYATGRRRKGSIDSFTYFQEEDRTPDAYSDEEAVESDDELVHSPDRERDLEAGVEVDSPYRKSSSRYRSSSDQPLLRRHESVRSDTQKHDDGGNFSQKLYIETEDLTMAIAGFKTSTFGSLIYLAICILTAGIGYLVFRWVPRWRMSLVGSPAPLRKCTWVVVEVSYGPQRRRPKQKAKKFQNQWGEFTVHYVAAEDYGYPISSVFTAPSKEKMNGARYDEDADLPHLRFVDYRYMRLLYHPIQDKFVLNNDWWDPQWVSIKALREGLDAEEREPREQVFGKNLIEIQQKTIPELLLDEVGRPLALNPCQKLTLQRRSIPFTSSK